MEEGGSVVELKKNGANILVTKHNRSVLFFLSCFCHVFMKHHIYRKCLLENAECEQCAVGLSPAARAVCFQIVQYVLYICQTLAVCASSG